MRLFTKYSRVNILASVLALLVGGMGYFFAVRYVLLHQLDNTIRIEEDEILDNVAKNGQLPKPANYRDQQIAFVQVREPVRRQFINTSWGYVEGKIGSVLPAAYGEEEHWANSREAGPDSNIHSGRRQEGPGSNLHGGDRRQRRRDADDPCRLLLFPVKVGDQYYTAYVSESSEEAQDLLVVIMYITAGMILLMLGVLFLANRLLLRRIWQPFYHTLEGIRAFNLSSRQLMPAETTDIDEFQRLDAAARQMTEKISGDYEMLKSFTENASHEMQTPLAIINSKLDLLIQDPRMREEHHRPVQAMYDAISRLRQLNQSLLLLTKIGNNQFPQTDTVDLAPLIGEKLAELEDPLKDRLLEVHTELAETRVSINNYLVDILLNNLFINAIRHNRQAGQISIQVGNGALRISNSGPAPSFDPSTIFDRFVKGLHSGGTGLGLAIVRQICDNYGFALSYSYLEELHTVEIRFPG